MNTVKARPTGRLVKVLVRTTSEDFSSDNVDRDGYPCYPKNIARWDEKPTEVYLFDRRPFPSFLTTIRGGENIRW